MPRELIAPERERVAFRDYQREPLASDQVSGPQRVRGRQARHGDGAVQGLRQSTRPLRRGSCASSPTISAAAGPTPPCWEPMRWRGDRDRCGGHRGATRRPGVRARRVPPGTRVAGRAGAGAPGGRLLAGRHLPRPHRLRAWAVRDGHVRIGDAVAVFGMGAIGLLALQLARLAGAHPVIAVDPIPLRREVAREVGADLTLEPHGLRRRQGDPPGHGASRRRRLHRVQWPSRRAAGRPARRLLPGNGGGRRLSRGPRSRRRGALQPPQHRVLARLLGAQPRVSQLGRAPPVRDKLAPAQRRQSEMRSGGAAGGRLRRPAHRVPQDRYRTRAQREARRALLTGGFHG